MKRQLAAVLAISLFGFSIVSTRRSALAQRSEPESASSTTLVVSGLRAQVTVRRDERGIPYIEATNDEDLYFAQGYVTASDRLWQMELLRRTVRGELSEIFGQATLADDKRHRMFGFARVLDKTVTHLPANLNIVLNAYAKGVNAFIDSRTDQNLPPEFAILKFKPRHWVPADSLAIGKLLAEYLSLSWQFDITRAALAALPKEKREALLPETSSLDVLVVGSDRARANTANKRRMPSSLVPNQQVLAQLNGFIESERQLLERLGLFRPTAESIQASNNWVVSGKRTVSGRPLLANDPHIPAGAPGVWYQTELSAPGIHVAGVTFPGAPGVTLGHNDRIAWGATNLGPDVQDVYIEKFNKDNPNRYLTPSGWREAEILHEQIKVRKRFTDPATEIQNYDVALTRHGPIIMEKDGARYALRWTAFDASTNELSGLFDANRARNWKEFTRALSQYNGPTQNFVYADVDGHIGYYGAGRIPIRKTGDGSLPYDGSTDDGEWTGYIPFDKLPHLYDPPSGVIITANQRVIGTSYPYFLSHAWAAPYRARRIFDLLAEKPTLTADDFRRIQGDTYSIAGVTFARAAVKSLRAEAGVPVDEKLNSTLVDFEKWDAMLNADSRIAPLVMQMRTAFRQHILNAALGTELMKVYGWPETDVFIDRVLADQPGDWLPKEFASYAELFRASYADARQALTKAIGADESQWLWGNMVKARFPHPLAQVPFIGNQFVVPPIPQNGGGGTVNVGANVSMRLIADTSDWDKTLNGIPLGESGLPNTPHWKDQLDDWRNITPRSLPFTKKAVESATKEMLTLQPGK
jgi:penicillin amidase